MVFSSDVAGMTKKAFTHVTKLATIYACLRQTSNILNDDESGGSPRPGTSTDSLNETLDSNRPGTSTESSLGSPRPGSSTGSSTESQNQGPSLLFQVKGVDVEAAYDFVKQSIQSFSSFKVKYRNK